VYIHVSLSLSLAPYTPQPRPPAPAATQAARAPMDENVRPNNAPPSRADLNAKPKPLFVIAPKPLPPPRVLSPEELAEQA
jgi:hypothetical protein